jgi:hypothetical protein
VGGRRGSGGAPGGGAAGAPGRGAAGAGRRARAQAGAGGRRRAPGARAAGGGRAAERRGVPPRTRLSPASRARIASRPCSANSSAPRVAPRIASQPLVRPRSGPGVATRPIGRRAAGGWRAAGAAASGATRAAASGATRAAASRPTRAAASGATRAAASGPTRAPPHPQRRHSRPAHQCGHTTGRTSSRRSRAMPRGRTCRPSGTALVDRQRRIGCRMRMWPKAWPHRHVASPPMPGPHDDVALPRAVWLQGCAVERLQRRNDRASARLRGWRAISYELSNARARECSPPTRSWTRVPAGAPLAGRGCARVWPHHCVAVRNKPAGAARARSRRSRCGHIVVWPSFETPIIAADRVAFGAVVAGPTALTWPRSAAWPHRHVAA